VKALISTLAGGALAISALALTAGQASAAGAPACNAGSGRDCVALDVVNSNAHSIRVNGQCLHWSSGEYHYYPNVTIAENSEPSVRVYSGSGCQSNTGFNDVRLTHWISSNGYRSVAV
jgi:hypothetical protein